MKNFKLLTGYRKITLIDQWEEVLREYPTTINEWGRGTVSPFSVPTILPVWHGTNYQPTWIVNPNLVQYTPPNYTTITTTPNGTGYVTIPYSTSGTVSGFNLTTSNPNGITYTTAGFGGALTTNTAMYTNGTFTSKF